MGRPRAGQAFPEGKLGNSAFLVLPAGLKGPAFLGTDNFSVLKLYNNSDVYAIFVGHVADMIATNAPVKFAGAWQPVEGLRGTASSVSRRCWWRKATTSARSTGLQASRPAPPSG